MVRDGHAGGQRDGARERERQAAEHRAAQEAARGGRDNDGLVAQAGRRRGHRCGTNFFSLRCAGAPRTHTPASPTASSDAHVPRFRLAAALSSQVEELQGDLGSAKKRIRKLEKERDVALTALRTELSGEVEEATKFLLSQLELRCKEQPQPQPQRLEPPPPPTPVRVELPAAVTVEISRLQDEVTSLTAGLNELRAAPPPPALPRAEDLAAAMWSSEMATSLMDRVAHQEQRSAANSEDVGTLRQFMDATEAKLTK